MESRNRLLLLTAPLAAALTLAAARRCAGPGARTRVEQQQTEEQAAAEEAAEDADSTPPRVIEPNVARRKIKTPRIDNENWEVGARPRASCRSRTSAPIPPTPGSSPTM